MKKYFLLINFKKRNNYLKNLLIKKNIIGKNFYKLRIFHLNIKIRKTQSTYSNNLNSLKTLIDEKSLIIKCLENDKSEHQSQLEKISTDNNSLCQENSNLRVMIEESQFRLEKDKEKFQELFQENVKDIKSKCP